MRARFVGDPRNGGDGPENLTHLGVAFTKGKWEPVSAEVGSNLSNHTHFEVEAFNGAEPAAFDHDGEPVAHPVIERRKPGRPRKV